MTVTEGRPNGAGYTAAQTLKEAGVPVTLVLDSGMGYAMEKADLVLVGAEAVTENGGIISKIGTYQLAIVAKALKKPFYVAAESYKFARLYPINQSDLPNCREKHTLVPLHGHKVPHGVQVDNPDTDYTPPRFITLLFTDLGILTPSAVSDELIKLYN